MTIDWIKFLPAVVLLLTPGSLFNSGKIRYRDVSRDWDGYWARSFSHGLHSIDFVRAALGTWLLLDSLHGAVNPHGLQKYEVLFLQGGIRVLAVFLQTVFCREEHAVNAPFTFVTGLLLGDIAPIVALFALAVALPVALGSRSAASYFPVLALSYLGVGVWFKGKGAMLGLLFGAIAVFLPLLWALMFRREFVSTYRAKRHAEELSKLR
jgi:hypothetical protein